MGQSNKLFRATMCSPGGLALLWHGRRNPIVRCRVDALAAGAFFAMLLLLCPQFARVSFASIVFSCTPTPVPSGYCDASAVIRPAEPVSPNPVGLPNVGAVVVTGIVSNGANGGSASAQASADISFEVVGPTGSTTLVPITLTGTAVTRALGPSVEFGFAQAFASIHVSDFEGNSLFEQKFNICSPDDPPGSACDNTLGSGSNLRSPFGFSAFSVEANTVFDMQVTVSGNVSSTNGIAGFPFDTFPFPTTSSFAACIGIDQLLFFGQESCPLMGLDEHLGVGIDPAFGLSNPGFDFEYISVPSGASGDVRLAVPEPDSLALFLAGLGVFGIVGRNVRRGDDPYLRHREQRRFVAFVGPPATLFATGQKCRFSRILCAHLRNGCAERLR